MEYIYIRSTFLGLEQLQCKFECNNFYVILDSKTQDSFVFLVKFYFEIPADKLKQNSWTRTC